MEGESKSGSDGTRRMQDIITRWSLVNRYRDGEPAVAELAADELAKIYLAPLYSWLLAKGTRREEAQETLQEFMLHLFGNGALKKAREEKGRLRSFLLTSLKNFMVSKWRRNGAERRGGGATHFPIDWLTVEEIAAVTEPGIPPEEAYDRGWAGGFLAAALASMERYYTDSGQGELYCCLLPVLEDTFPPGRYDEIAAELGSSVSSLRVAAFRLKKRFAKEVRAAAAEAFDLEPGEELEAELRAVFGC